MAFLRTANAIVVKPNISPLGWRQASTTSKVAANVSRNLVQQATDILGQTFDPNRWLLTHCTIVASVDAVDVPNVKLGSSYENGRKIIRKYADFRITPETVDLINNNNDSFERKALLKSYSTFIGAQNFCFAPGTPILMADGTYCNIEDIRVGDMVVTHTGQAQAVTHMFVRDYDGPMQAISVNRYQNPILATPNHPFRKLAVTAPPITGRVGTSLRNKLRYRKDQIQNFLCGAKHTLGDAVTVDTVWADAGSLEEGHILMGHQPVPNAAHGSNDFAYLLGYYLAEGCRISQSKDYGVIFAFGATEQHLVDHVKALVSRVYPQAKVVVSNTLNNVLRTVVYSAQMQEDMLKFGGEYSHGKRIHADVFGWEPESLRCLMAGWLSGDGDFHTGTQRLRGVSISRDLVMQMHHIASKCGVKTTFVCTKTRIGEVTNQIQMRVQSGDVRSYDVIPRYNVWTLIVSKDSVNEISTLAHKWLRPLVNEDSRKKCDFSFYNDTRVFRVSSNTSVPYTGKVYNFEVQGDNSYVVQPGVAVHNCEHVQIEDLSKGRIIDAVARDLGHSVYIDILVATERKHKELVTDIESGRMSGLSMGCSVQFCICSKCGNVAEDETQMCDCIRYHKGNTFIDERGNRSKVAELCGHHTFGDTAGINFIEASWVANPAFTGAVARNILTPEMLSADAIRQANTVLSQPPKAWTQGDGTQKAARDLSAEGFDFGDMGGDDAGGDAEADADKEKKPDTGTVLTKLQDDVINDIVNRVHTRLQDELAKKDKENEPSAEDSTSEGNDALSKTAAILRKAYSVAVGTIIQHATSDADLLDKVARLDSHYGMASDRQMYRTVLHVGSIQKLGSEGKYLGACRDALGRKVTRSEAGALLRLGRILTHLEKFSTTQSPKGAHK